MLAVEASSQRQNIMRKKEKVSIGWQPTSRYCFMTFSNMNFPPRQMSVSKNGAYHGIADTANFSGRIWNSKVRVILPAKLHCGRSESQAHQRHVIEIAVIMGWSGSELLDLSSWMVSDLNALFVQEIDMGLLVASPWNLMRPRIGRTVAPCAQRPSAGPRVPGCAISHRWIPPVLPEELYLCRIGLCSAIEQTHAPSLYLPFIHFKSHSDNSPCNFLCGSFENHSDNSPRIWT